jgi:hypothetical protein
LVLLLLVLVLLLCKFTAPGSIGLLTGLTLALLIASFCPYMGCAAVEYVQCRISCTKR